MSLLDIQQKKLKLGGQFQKTFGVSLHSYWDIYTGLDIIKFDEEFIKPNDDERCEDAICARYGDDAVSLVRRLI